MSANCEDCERMEKKLRNLQVSNGGFDLQLQSITEYNGAGNLKIFITPALLLNGNLKAYGDVPIEKLYKLINHDSIES